MSEYLLVFLKLYSLDFQSVCVLFAFGHRSETEGDLTYLRLGTNGDVLSFIIIHR